MSESDPGSVLSERSRLLIMATLAATGKEMDFVSLVEATGMTKGNLSAHVRKLEEFGYVQVTKAFVDRKPLTRYRCSETGRRGVKSYLKEIERMLKNL